MASRGRRGPRVAAPKPPGPHRMCIGCRESFPREALIRLVRGPAGELGVDRYLRAPGRGAHLCYNRTCIEQAVKRKAIGRAFPGLPGGSVPDLAALCAQVVAAIEARVADGLSLGRLRRAAVSGADALEDAWRAGRLQLLILATDAGDNTADLWAAREKAAGLLVVREGTAASLGHSQGADHRVAIGVVETALAESLRQEFERRDRVLVAA